MPIDDFLEGTVNRIKMIKRHMYGRARFDLGEPVQPRRRSRCWRCPVAAELGKGREPVQPAAAKPLWAVPRSPLSWARVA
jgi:hypothetical protein